MSRATLGPIVALAMLPAVQASAAVTVCVSPPANAACPYHTIQAGVNAAATGGPGGIVKVLAGTYNESVNMPSSGAGGDNMQVIGAGKTLTFVDSGPPVSGIGFFLFLVNGVKISNLTVQNSINIGIDSVFANDTVISGVRVQGVGGNPGNGITQSLGNGGQVLSSEVRACAGYAIFLSGNRPVAKSNTVSQVGGSYGIFVDDVGGGPAVVTLNKVTTSGQVSGYTGIYVHTKSTALAQSVVQGNTLENVGASTTTFGMHVSDDLLMVTNNKLTWAGQALVECVGPCLGGKVTGNTVVGSQTLGFNLFTDANPSPTVQANKASYTAGFGFLLNGPTGLTAGQGLNLLTNSVTDTALGADCFHLLNSGHSLTGNTAKNCGGSGFYTNGDNFALTSNSATNVKYSGFAVNGNNGNTTSFSGVLLQSNKASGAYQQAFALFDGTTSHGTYQPVGSVLAGNSAALSRQDLCTEDGGSYGPPGNLFAAGAIATTCDLRY